MPPTFLFFLFDCSQQFTKYQLVCSLCGVQARIHQLSDYISVYSPKYNVGSGQNAGPFFYKLRGNIYPERIILQPDSFSCPVVSRWGLGLSSFVILKPCEAWESFSTLPLIFQVVLVDIYVRPEWVAYFLPNTSRSVRRHWLPTVYHWTRQFYNTEVEAPECLKTLTKNQILLLASFHDRNWMHVEK